MKGTFYQPLTWSADVESAVKSGASKFTLSTKELNWMKPLNTWLNVEIIQNYTLGFFSTYYEALI